jgi:predicted small integral membrane protein
MKSVWLAAVLLAAVLLAAEVATPAAARRADVIHFHTSSGESLAISKADAAVVARQRL